MNPGDFEFQRFRKPPLHNARLPAAAKTVLFVGVVEFKTIRTHV